MNMEKVSTTSLFLMLSRNYKTKDSLLKIQQLSRRERRNNKRRVNRKKVKKKNKANKVKEKRKNPRNRNSKKWNKKKNNNLMNYQETKAEKQNAFLLKNMPSL